MSARATNIGLVSVIAAILVLTGIAVIIALTSDDDPTVTYALANPGGATIGIREMSTSAAIELAEEESGLAIDLPEGVPDGLELAVVKFIPTSPDGSLPDRPAVQLRYAVPDDIDRTLQVEFRGTRPRTGDSGEPVDLGVEGVEAEYLPGLMVPTWVASDGVRHLTLFYAGLGTLAPTDDEVEDLLASLFAEDAE